MGCQYKNSEYGLYNTDFPNGTSNHQLSHVNCPLFKDAVTPKRGLHHAGTVLNVHHHVVTTTAAKSASSVGCATFSHPVIALAAFGLKLYFIVFNVGTDQIRAT